MCIYKNTLKIILIKNKKPHQHAREEKNPQRHHRAPVPASDHLLTSFFLKNPLAPLCLSLCSQVPYHLGPNALLNGGLAPLRQSMEPAGGGRGVLCTPGTTRTKPMAGIRLNIKLSGTTMAHGSSTHTCVHTRVHPNSPGTNYSEAPHLCSLYAHQLPSTEGKPPKLGCTHPSRHDMPYPPHPPICGCLRATAQPAEAAPGDDGGESAGVGTEGWRQPPNPRRPHPKCPNTQLTSNSHLRCSLDTLCVPGWVLGAGNTEGRAARP